MYKFGSRIRYSECGVDKKLTIPAMVNYFQDCSTFHSEGTEGSWDALMEKGLVWMICCWEIEVDRYPALYEEVETGTVPYSIKGVFGCRNYCMMDSSGEMISRANSVWVLIDLKTQMPVRIPPEIADAYPKEEKLKMEYLGRKVPFPEEGEIVRAGKLTVRQRDLDINRHVNNEQYIRFATDALNEMGFGDQTHPSKIRVEYRKQAFKGDLIYPVINKRTDQNDNEQMIFTVSLNGSDGKPFCLVEIKP